MSIDRHGLFEQLDPPPGGADAFRRRLDVAGSKRRAPGRYFVVAVSAAALVAVAAVALLIRGERIAGSDSEHGVALYDAPQFDRLLGRPLERTEPRVILNDRRVRVAEIPTERGNVRIYRLE